jgi:5-amino-6-(5-phosphoribosylamino)uracil reductase
MDRFQKYCRRKEELATGARPAGFATVRQGLPPPHALVVENAWTRTCFDGPFYVSRPASPAHPAVSLVFVQSLDGNTGADDPATLGGGETDLHVIYEGLSRAAADAVLAGATTARGEEIVFSVWHPQMVELRLELGKTRHPAQIVVTNGRDLPLDTALMFTTPAFGVWLIAPSSVAARLRERLSARPWIGVIDAGEPLSLAPALRELRGRGVEYISAIGGRRTATALIDEGLVQDVYLTTAPKSGGQPNTPFYEGAPLSLHPVLEKHGRGSETGVRFEHFLLRR